MRAPALTATDIARIFEPFLRAVFAWWRTHWARRVDRKAHRHNLRGSVALKNTGRVVRPGLRVYARKSEIPRVLGGLGINILTTPRGVMTGRQARKEGVGGELLCEIY